MDLIEKRNNKVDKKIIPAIRFPDFANDGEWEKDSFENTFLFLPNNTLSRAELNYDNGSTKNIHYGDVLIRFGDCMDVQETVLPFISDEAYADRLQHSGLQDGDVVIADTAEDETVGKCTEIFNVYSDKVVSGLHTIPIRPQKQFAIPYLGFYFNSASYRKQLLPLMQGVKVMSISKTAIGKTLVVYPSLLSEQCKIGSCLFSMDAFISATKKKLELFKTYKIGLLQKLFPAKGKKLPELRFKEFEKDGEWVVKKLGDVAEVFQGYGFPERMQGKNKGLYPFIKVSDISNTVNKGCVYITEAANYVDEQDLGILKAKPIPVGTIVFAKIGEAIRLNRRVVLKQKSLIDNNVAGVKAISDKSSDSFMFYIMTMIDLLKYAGGVVPAIKKSAIEDIEITLPVSLSEQCKIAFCLSSVDEAINAYTEKVVQLGQYKKGLMQQLFPNT